MMHTEEEARERWCPFSRTVEKWPEGPTTVRNRLWDAEKNEEVNLVGCQCIASQCIASQCMAWQWDTEVKFYDRPKPASAEVVNTDRGYCGLASKPE